MKIEEREEIGITMDDDHSHSIFEMPKKRGMKIELSVE
jgi:hypothetical protein